MQNITVIAPLNVNQPNTLVIAYAKQNDVKSRWYQAKLLAGDVPWTPPNYATGTIRFQKPDGHGGWYDELEDGAQAVVLNGSTVTMGMAEQVLTCPGDVKIDLMFADANGSVFSAFTWTLRVEKNVIDDAVIEDSDDYFAILAGQVTAVQTAAEYVAEVAGTVTGPFHITTTISEFPHYVNDSRIIADTSNKEMRVFNAIISDDSIFSSDITWETTTGQIEFNGTKSGGEATLDFDVDMFDKE